MGIDRTAAAQAIDAFIRALGRDTAVETELAGTGSRVAEAYGELISGYAVDTKNLLAASVLSTKSGGLVVVRDIPVVTTCPHHLLPATGIATVALQARERIVGLGTLAALVDAYARRLTLQERIGEGVVSDLEKVLEPEWCGCRLVLTHGCMTARGERAVGSRVETVALRGASSPKAVAIVHGALGVGT
ncbi:MAG: GTP cyclohydrolase I [Deltaproteobacteria bacterium]|nr:GTP cyclohydrolase I [Deltaproteobacteria bacterium]